ncbi:MAG: hypothetical protein JRF33_19340 [Deltaproteobacteria bacterium]|nr:hypothetical protein [Deltaproteobacteria bacterium]
MLRFFKDGLVAFLGLLVLVSLALPARSSVFGLEDSNGQQFWQDRRGRTVAFGDPWTDNGLSLAPEYLDMALDDLNPKQDFDATIRLSLDLGWQARVRRLLYSELRKLDRPASAALVAVDVRSREVWCLTSVDLEGPERPLRRAEMPVEQDSPWGTESPWMLLLEETAGSGGGTLLDWTLEIVWLAEGGGVGPLRYLMDLDRATAMSPAAVLNGVLALAMTRQDIRGRILTGAGLASADGVDAWMVAASDGVVVGVWFGLNEGSDGGPALSRAAERSWQGFVQEWLRYGPAVAG